MPNYIEVFDNFVQQTKKKGLFRNFTPLVRCEEIYPLYNDNNGRVICAWCSNDYLNMSQHDVVKSAVINSINLGCGSGGTRNIAGTTRDVCELEEELADMHEKESAALFSSGYCANDVSISTLCKLLGPNVVVFSDQLNHASMLDGIKKGNPKEKIIFKHNCLKDLREKLSKFSKETKKLILFESVYSMDGDIAPIEGICELASEFDAMTYVDEVHAVGLYGSRGSGLASQIGISKKIDVIQGSLSKAFGSLGGYIAASKSIVDAIKSCGRGFIFTSVLPPISIAAALASVKHLKNSNEEREKFFRNVRETREKFEERGIKIMTKDSHILPIMIGDHMIAEAIFKDLFENSRIFAQFMKYPTVPNGMSRFRITPCASHDKKMIDFLTSEMHRALKKNKLINQQSYEYKENEPSMI